MMVSERVAVRSFHRASEKQVFSSQLVPKNSRIALCRGLLVLSHHTPTWSPRPSAKMYPNSRLAHCRLAYTKHVRRFHVSAIPEYVRDNGEYAPFPVKVTYGGKTYAGVVAHPTTVLMAWNGQGSCAPKTLSTVLKQDPNTAAEYFECLDLHCEQGGDINIEYVPVSDQVATWANNAYRDAQVDGGYTFANDNDPHPDGDPGPIPNIPKFTPSASQSNATKFRDVPTKMRRPDVTGVLPCTLENCGGATRGCVIPPRTIVIYYCGYAANNLNTLADHKRCTMCTVEENKYPRIRVGVDTRVTFTSISRAHAEWCNNWTVYDKHSVVCRDMNMPPAVPAPANVRPAL